MMKNICIPVIYIMSLKQHNMFPTITVINVIYIFRLPKISDGTRLFAPTAMTSSILRVAYS